MCVPDKKYIVFKTEHDRSVQLGMVRYSGLLN